MLIGGGSFRNVRYGWTLHEVLIIGAVFPLPHINQVTLGTH